MINILYSDDSIIICQKPAGILSEGQMPAILAEQCGICTFPVHRLDRDVGGIMVYAKTEHSAAVLSSEIQNGDFKKEYLAVIHGIPDSNCGTWRDLLYHDARKNKSYVVSRSRRGVREALLDYEMLKTVNDDAGNKLSLVRVLLHTGRTHQIRVQFASRVMPLFGDSRYGAHDKKAEIALWSHKISLLHPKTHAPLTFEIPMPTDGVWKYFI